MRDSLFDSKSEGSRFAYLVAYELLCDMEAEERREYDIVPNPYAKESDGTGIGNNRLVL